MKKKLIRIANQINTLENKIQNGENVVESMEQMEKLVESLSFEEVCEVDAYLAEHFNRIDKK